MRRFLTCLLAFLLIAPIVLGANIHGDIYDFSLNKIGNVLVEINTAPKQFIVSKNGTYSFAVPIGSYEVKAQHYEGNLLVSSTSENITVKGDGDYILDLILFPIINEEELLEGEIKAPADYKNNIIAFSIAILATFFILFYFYNKGKTAKKEEEKEEIKSEEEKKEEIKKEDEKTKEQDFYGENVLDKVIEIIKAEGGRTTQKEIRKKVPLSEGKISLIIAELEAKEKISKIKKGRGNIIILK